MKRLLPCYPLFVKDPFFSIWMDGEDFSTRSTVFWHGEKKPMRGIVRVGKESYCFLGNDKDSIILSETSVKIGVFSTICCYSTEKFNLTVEYFSPLPLTDLDILSCPACYLQYKIEPKKDIGEVCVTFMIEDRICYDTCLDEERLENVRASVIRLGDCECAFMGLRRQMPLSHSGDWFGADWGYYYLTGDRAFIRNEDERKLMCAENDGTEGKFVLAFDDICSIFYYGEWLRGYWFRDGRTILDAVRFSLEKYDYIREVTDNFERDFEARVSTESEDYAYICRAAYRQTVAAHKLVTDGRGRVLFLSKECDSDGCIATVDVTYPSSPLFLLFNPKLLKGMLIPILDFARMPVWSEDFAPHDAGLYPYCLGQFYAIDNGKDKYNQDIYIADFLKKENVPMYYQFPKGSKIYNIKQQMPVEECGNMLLLAAAIYDKDGDIEFVRENYDLYKKWAQYLVRFGLIPESQLCTDDFAGHLDKNANLSIKAILGIGAFSRLAEVVGDSTLSAEMLSLSKEYAKKWCEIYQEGNHTVLAKDLPEPSFSLKYNLVFDDLLGLGLFPRSLKEAEADYYLTRRAYFGVPLDSRAGYTKSDWTVWVATLTSDKKKRGIFLDGLVRFLRESPSRVPFSDWYETEDGKYHMFRNRSVQGGVFMLALLHKS